MYVYVYSSNLWKMGFQVMWSFSLFLEAVAILPQLVLLQRTRNIDNLTGQYVFLLGYALNLSTVRKSGDVYLIN